MIQKVKDIWVWITRSISDPPDYLVKACAAGSLLMSVVFRDHSYLLYTILFWLFIIDSKIDKLK